MAKVRRKPDVAQRTQYCHMYRVLLHNDDITTFWFVMYILTGVFRLEVGKAAKVASQAHHTGISLVGVMPLEQAEFRVDRAHSMARAQKYPLTFTYEQE